MWLREHGWKSLADVPPAVLDEWVERFDIIWLMGVWMPSMKGRRLAQNHSGLAQEIREALPDVAPEDVVSSPYAVMDYTVSSTLGGDAALAQFRKRLHDRGLRLMLDLVPNHVALDHPWVSAHPDLFVQGTAADMALQPKNYFRAKTAKGMKIFAHGRDPYFDGWQDTVQVNIFSPQMRAAMTELLMTLGSMCDGLRCDMSMLLINRIFKKTWNNKVVDAPETEFWPEAVSAVKKRYPGFIFLAEVYWDLEWEMQHLGFDFTYDKKLYDLLRDNLPLPVRLHLKAAPEFQARSARMIENHDEKRAAFVFSPPRTRTAAIITYSVPGLRFFHEGQFEGRRVKVPVQLRRRQNETLDPGLSAFYEKFLSVLSEEVLRNGNWQMLDCVQAWQNNFSHGRMFAFWWQLGPECRMAVVNDAADPSQCHVPIPSSAPNAVTLRFKDILSDRVYDRDRADVQGKGMYFDMGGYDAHFFRVLPSS